MTDEKKPTKPFQLLGDGMLIDGTEYFKGDTVHLEAKHGERLADEGNVGPVGTLEKRAKAQAEAAKVIADAERKIREADTDDEPANVDTTDAAATPTASTANPVETGEPTGRRTIRRGDN